VSATLRARIEAGERLTGTFVQSRDPGSCEFLGRLGFDLLCIEGEHSAMAAETVQALVAAADLAPIPSLVRVAGNEPVAIAAALDAGAHGIVVPRVETAEQAAAAVAAARFPPQGARGLGPSRATGFGAQITEYLARANRDLLLAIQVETRAAVDGLDSLLSVEGLDMIFVGPGDLACSMEIADLTGPEVHVAVESVLERSRAAGRLTGVFAGTPADAKRWRDAGTDLVLLGSDLTWLAKGVKSVVNRK
jgi:4-hydroxy-2-oxoheptanedioate aldolase